MVGQQEVGDVCHPLCQAHAVGIIVLGYGRAAVLIVRAGDGHIDAAHLRLHQLAIAIISEGGRLAAADAGQAVLGVIAQGVAGSAILIVRLAVIRAK